MPRKTTDTQQSKRTYNCTNCGHEFDVYPPDDAHKIALLEPCDKGDSIAIRYECQDCHTSNTRYWDVHHFIIVSSSYKTDMD